MTPLLVNPSSVDRIVNPTAVARTVVIEIAKNLAMSVPAVRKLRAKLGRTIVTEESDQLGRYVFRLFDAVTKFCGGVAGKSVLEIGPGDNLVTGLAFLAAGATRYTAIDRFPGPYASQSARAWYRLLANNWPHGEWPRQLDPERFPDYGNVVTKALSVEDIHDVGKHDIVCSYHVGEHVSDIDAFATLTKRALSASGVALHEIDFGGHQWNRFGDPFLFLKFSDLVWTLMGSARGEPNRVRFAQYRQCFERSGMKVDVPRRRQCRIDPADKWVGIRADDSFTTTDATFVLRQAAD